MLKAFRLPLLAACVLALPAAAQADDAALAAKLVGTWEGRWSYDTMGGKLVVTITSAAGTSLKGKSTWYATAVGDFNDAFTKTKLKDGKLTVTEATMDFEATVNAEGTAMEGTWVSPMASGGMKLAKKEEKKEDKK
jgi:hypothetical protein